MKPKTTMKPRRANKNTDYPFPNAVIRLVATTIADEVIGKKDDAARVRLLGDVVLLMLGIAKSISREAAIEMVRETVELAATLSWDIKNEFALKRGEPWGVVRKKT